MLVEAAKLLSTIPNVYLKEEYGLRLLFQERVVNMKMAEDQVHSI